MKRDATMNRYFRKGGERRGGMFERIERGMEFLAKD
jgi:hypothetical protein